MKRAQLEQLKKKAQACAIAIRKHEVDDDGEVSSATIDELEHELQELAGEICDQMVSNSLPFVIVELCAELLREQRGPRERVDLWPTGRRQALEDWAAGKWYDKGPTCEQMQELARWLLRSAE